MNVRVVLAAILALGISGYLVKLMLGTSAPVATNPNLVPNRSEAQEPLPIPERGPHPKVSVSEHEFEFGAMQVGETQSHEFVFTNLGEVPLTIKMGETTCQCTYGDLKKGETRKILPGESQTIKLTWKPEFATSEFSKGADIITDDPMEKTVTLRVVGFVGSKLSTHPPKEWPCPDIIDDKSVVCKGSIGSGVLMDFNVTGVESHGKPLEFDLEPLEGEGLRANQAKFGHNVLFKIPADMPMGSFAVPVTIKTDVPEQGENATPGKMMELEILAKGFRRGPVRLAGPDWIDEKMAISLGGFDASAGKQLLVPMFVRNPPAEGFQFTKPPETTPSDLKVELVRDDKNTGKAARLFLKLEYPAGKPRVSYRGENPGMIRLFTNHPSSPEIEYQVFFASY